MKMILFFHCKYSLIYGIFIDVEIIFIFIRAENLARAYSIVYYYFYFGKKMEKNSQLC